MGVSGDTSLIFLRGPGLNIYRSHLIQVKLTIDLQILNLQHNFHGDHELLNLTDLLVPIDFILGTPIPQN